VFRSWGWKCVVAGGPDVPSRGHSGGGRRLPRRASPLGYTEGMRGTFIATLTACMVLAIVSLAGPVHSGERLFTGGVVHTPEGVVRSAILVRDGRIVAVGPRKTLHPSRGAEVVDLHGAHVLPGLCDAHLHLTGYGRSLEEVDLRGARSWTEVVRRARHAAEDLPEGAWLTGRGWDQNLWPSKAFPDRQELDRAFPRRPVLLRRIDGHAAVANAVALRAAGIGRDTADPSGGRILRRSDGQPTGVLVDDAVDLVSRVIPRPDDGTVERWILRSANALAKDGWRQALRRRGVGKPWRPPGGRLLRRSRQPRAGGDAGRTPPGGDRQGLEGGLSGGRPRHR